MVTRSISSIYRFLHRFCMFLQIYTLPPTPHTTQNTPKTINVIGNSQGGNLDGPCGDTLFDAYSGPFYGNKTILFRINEGSIADVSNTQKDWTEIILIDGKKGWVPNESIRMLR